MLPDFLNVVIDSGVIQDQIKAVGSTNYSRVSPTEVLDYEIPCPILTVQKRIADFYANSKEKYSALNAELTHQQDLLDKLRQAILQEAIEGKLTAEWRLRQPPPTETAAQLLARIRAEKAQLLKEKKIAKQKPLPPIKPEEIPFALPEGWVWCRLGDYALFERGRFSIRPRNDPSCFGGKYPFIQIGSLDDKGSVVNTFIQTLNEKGFSVSKYFEKGTLMVAIVGGTIGNLGVLGRDMCFPDSIVGVRPRSWACQDYILSLLRYYQPQIRKLAYQMAGQPNIKLTTLNNLVLALPPLAEQQAIVAKVERLLAVVDELAGQNLAGQAQAGQLMQAVLKEAFQANGS
jgi:type I restriction enzyme S subunit